MTAIPSAKPPNFDAFLFHVQLVQVSASIFTKETSSSSGKAKRRSLMPNMVSTV